MTEVRDGLPGGIAVRRLFVVLWMALIFGLSSIPDPEIPSGLGYPGHALLYFVLGGLVFAASRLERSTRLSIALAVVLASVYGVTDELHQFFVPGRTPDVLDWAWDTVGALGGAIAAALLVARAQARRLPR